MSSDNSEVEADARAADTCCCASCGIFELDDIKLKECDGCDLVKYCSDECQQLHRPDHESECKERAAELLRDELLFKQPESSHMGDCPICCLPLPIDHDEKSILYTCCSKYICNGCSHVHKLRQFQGNMQITCPFCRHPAAQNREEADRNLMKRIEANDPIALNDFGKRACENGDYDEAFKYWTKAAELGDVDAHYELSVLYREGHGVEKDEAKEIFHAEEAAIAGHPSARINLACYEERRGNEDRARKHRIISASLGSDRSMKFLKEYYKHGFVSKEDFAAALRAHHAAVNAMKSPQREAAERAMAAVSKR